MDPKIEWNQRKKESENSPKRAAEGTGRVYLEFSMCACTEQIWENKESNRIDIKKIRALTHSKERNNKILASAAPIAAP